MYSANGFAMPMSFKLPKDVILTLLEEKMDELEDMGNALICVLRGDENEEEIDRCRSEYNSLLVSFNNLLDTYCNEY